jgi:hypothetical protein
MSAYERQLQKKVDAAHSADEPHYDRVDQWVDWGGHTVTIDPIGNSAWIHEGQGGKHQQSKERGRLYDEQDTRHMMSLLAKHTEPRYESFIPTSRALDALPKFPSRRNGNCDVWRGMLRDIRGEGQLPVISQRIRDGMQDVSKEQIEREVYSIRDAISTRVFSRDGVPDHGIGS